MSLDAPPTTHERRLESFARADQFTSTPGVIAARSLLARTLAVMLRTLNQQLAVYRERIEALFTQPPDHDVFGSLPGIGPKLGPRLPAELGSDRNRFDSAESLQCFSAALAQDNKTPPGVYSTSWVGNSFPGDGGANGFRHWVQNGADEIEVAPDGTVIAGTDWDEAGRCESAGWICANHQAKGWAPKWALTE